ncbi:protein meiotic P26-like [Oculina patagonica]
MESILQNLKERVTCSICQGTFTNPKTIACLHTFCGECLEKHALASQREGKFPCPECQEDIDVPEGNRFDELPISSLHNNLLGLFAVQQWDKGSEITCGNCKKNSAESYCFGCERFMCPVCLNAHERFRSFAFEGHKVTPIKEFQADDYEALLKRNSFCTQQNHDKQIMKFYCIECEVCICQICIVTNHKDHNIESLDKAAEGAKASIMAGVELLEEKKKGYNDLIRQLEEAAAELDANTEAAMLEVSRAADEMVAKVREREREAIASLEALDNTQGKVNAARKPRSP